MPDDYNLPTDEVIDRLERIERRLDNMGQRIAYLEGSLGQRVAFLEGAVLRPRRDTSVPSKIPMSADAHSRFIKRFIWICRIMMVVQVLTVILLQFF